MSAKDFYVKFNMFNYGMQKRGSGGGAEGRMRGRGGCSSSLGAEISLYVLEVSSQLKQFR